MVGLVTRGRTFWYRRTIPVPLRESVARIMKAADLVLFDFKAPISLRKSKAKTLRNTEASPAPKLRFLDHYGYW
jgi:pyruvate-formate lyase-activating enzyme